MQPHNLQSNAVCGRECLSARAVVDPFRLSRRMLLRALGSYGMHTGGGVP